MVNGQETVFCWVSVPELTRVVSSVACFYYLATTHQQRNNLSRLLVGR
jgi:hypothetical protein